MMLIKSYGNPFSESDLKTIEMYLEFKFPEQYKIFLINHNGGEIDKKIFCFKNDSTDGSVLDRLFGFVPNEYKNILVYYRIYKNRIPKYMFPIGYDPFSNLIILSIKGVDRGKVYFWDHDFEVEDGVEPDYSNLTLIADSFDEFINSLESDDEVEI